MSTTTPDVNESKKRDNMGFWGVEIVRLVITLLIFNFGYNLYYAPKQVEMAESVISDNAQNVVLINFAKITRESNTTDRELLQEKVAEAIKRLNEQGFIVLDSVNTLGLHEVYEIETKFIDSIEIE